MTASSSLPQLQSRYRGCLLGLAVGDAVGTTVEFSPPGTFEPVQDMVGGGPFRLPAGAWTDDTSMALCLADSLLAEGRFDPIDQLQRYTNWFRNGYRSSTGTCFDIGNATRAAITRFEDSAEPFPGEQATEQAGNGPLMRLAPVPMVFGTDLVSARMFCAQNALTTHGAVQATQACVIYGELLIGALNGHSKDELLAGENGCEFAIQAIAQRLIDQQLSTGTNADTQLHPELAEICAGSFRNKQPPQIRGTGYIVDALEAALWAVWSTDDFRAAILAAVNLGDDADTTAAIAGQLAGALHGLEGIPREWRERVHIGVEIQDIADQLLELSGRVGRGDQVPS